MSQFRSRIVVLCLTKNWIFQLQAHFDERQYERKRADGLRRLRPDAVPMLFPHIPEDKLAKIRQPRKSPKKGALHVWMMLLPVKDLIRPSTTIRIPFPHREGW